MTEVVKTQSEQDTFDITSALDGFAFDIDRLAADFDHAKQDGSDPFPTWWYDDSQRTDERKIQLFLSTEVATPENVGRYYVLGKRLKEAKRQSLEYGIGEIISDPEVVAKGMQGADDNCRMLREDVLVGLAETGRDHLLVEALKGYFATSSYADMLAINDEKGSFQSRVRDLLCTAKNLSMLRTADQAEAQATGRPEITDRKWAEGVFESFGFTSYEAQRLSFTTTHSNVDLQMSKVIHAVDSLGVENIRKIARNFPYIWGIDCYSLPQLERMVRLSLQPDEEAERLSRHDVVAVLVNRAGDNGVLIDAAAKLEASETAGRYVFGEITRMHHIRNTLAKLADMHVKPSTIVIVAHSAETGLIISDKRHEGIVSAEHAVVATAALVQHANERMKGSGTVGFPLREMQGIAEIVDNYMQPSRGIDDPDSDVGRKKIVLVGCHLGQETDVRDIGEGGETITVARDSFAGQLAELLFSQGVKGLDIYAAPDSMQIVATDKGIKYAATPETPDDDRRQLPGMLIRLTRSGIERKSVPEVPLRG